LKDPIRIAGDEIYILSLTMLQLNALFLEFLFEKTSCKYEKVITVINTIWTLN